MQIRRLSKRTLESNTPYILINSMRNWDALHKWDLKFFQTRFKDLEITLNYNLPSIESPYLLNAEGHHKILTLEQAIVSVITQSEGPFVTIIEGPWAGYIPSSLNGRNKITTTGFNGGRC